MRLRHLLFAFVVLAASSHPSSAQDTGQVGLTMAYPAAIGVIWHATDGVAIRPDFAFSHADGDSLVSSSSQGSLGVSALLYVRKWDGLRAYVAPRFGYQRSSLSADGSPGLSTSTNLYSYSGSFGAEYLLHPRFAVFAETGIAYTRSTTDNGPTLPSIATRFTSNNWGTRAGVGAIFYF